MNFDINIAPPPPEFVPAIYSGTGQCAEKPKENDKKNN